MSKISTNIPPKLKQISKKLYDIFFSFPTTILLLALLGIGASVGTFIENDYSTSTARVLVYNHWWYGMVMVLSIINMIGIIMARKMYKSPAKFIFHISFVVILLGAIITRYGGYEGIMQIDEGETQNEMHSLEPYIQVFVQTKTNTYYQDYLHEFGAIGDNNFNYELKFEGKTLNIGFSDYKFAKKKKNIMNLISTNVSLGEQSEIVKLVGKRGQPPAIRREINFKNSDNSDIKIIIAYGSKKLTIPFYIKLNDFDLQRYAGSKSPSSYSSEVTLIDLREDSKIKMNYKIYMNHILDYDGYKFFQSSYKPDESGTILSVNNDPGTIPTYIGYFLLTLGLLMNVFDKKSRFIRLTKYARKFNISLFLVVSLFLAIGTNTLKAVEPTQEKPIKQTDKQIQAREQNQAFGQEPNGISDDDIVKYLKTFKANSNKVAEKFSYLITQSPQGRMKPIDSLNYEIVNKLTKRNTFLGMNANQVVLGMLSNPDIWRNIKMIKIKTPKLKQTLGIDVNRKYIAFKEVFDSNGVYKLQSLTNTAFAMDPNKRGTFQKAIIKLDERINIAYMVYYGSLFKLFPQIGGTQNNETIQNKWYTPLESVNKFRGKDQEIVAMMIRGFINNVIDTKYDEAIKYIDLIALYQSKVGSAVMPDIKTTKSEIWFNKLDVFFKLTLAYMLLGVILFVLAFGTIFSKKIKEFVIKYKIGLVSVSIVLVLFFIHTLGLAHRWYISGHAPWSNLYESFVYIAYSILLAGIIFGRKSLLALSATIIMAGVFMFTAHLGDIDPQITQLVPVLKSYWLSVHVSIITGSYGFLAIGALLGYMSLVLFVFRSKDKTKNTDIDDSIRQSLAIGEASIILGLSMLAVGNFLGGIWANESWGRYWGWDPKETWAYISIVIYAIVIHLRMIPKLNTPYIFAITSTLAFATILMTYVGVNFYLSGLHSYATGDPVPIPTWAYILTAVVFITIALAYRGRDLGKLKV
jgi:cytochrome c-type biogenesis protein CcsB